MTNPNYILLAVDAATDRVDDGEVLRLISNEPKISGIWTYMPYVYILKTSLDTQGVKDLMRRKFENTPRFVAISVDINRRNGWLPTEAWEKLRT